MGSIKIVKRGDNIFSPLGTTSIENFDVIKEGRSEIAKHTGLFDLPEDFCGSIFNRTELKEFLSSAFGEASTLTLFEQVAIYSAKKAIEEAQVDPASSDTVFVLSTTKGNVDLLSEALNDERCYLGYSAKRIAAYFGNINVVPVVSNACISGVCAQIAAVRFLLSGRYKRAVVVGCDLLSKFIISGFQSFKALSPAPCRPYDRDRIGLNLGEAAATIVLEATENDADDDWTFSGCSIHNDANHISGPSRTGEGSYRVLTDILCNMPKEEIGFINAHGTSTAYNDEMESIAISRAGLSEIPLNGLKGYFGHTLGAAGILETIISMKAIDAGIILPTKGYENSGTSESVNISNKIRETDKKGFVKILSGFGGSNAGIAYRKGGDTWK